MKSYLLMVAALAAEMGDAYPELIRKGELIENPLLEEEQRFSRTLDTGMGILKGVMEKAAAANSTVIDGASAFLLYDTYGFPLDLTQDIARENDLGVDLDGFSEALQRQQERGRTGTAQQLGDRDIGIGIDP